MTARRTVKTTPRFVGVITTPEELRFAARMKSPPDFFELRLDHLCSRVARRRADVSQSETATIPRLPAPIIITARDPCEGGANNLSIKQRRQLLAQFLDRATYIDIEMRNARALKSIVDLVRRTEIRLIISFHDFDSTPSVPRLSALALRAKSLGAEVFKVATRTDTRDQLARLRDFTTQADACRAVTGRRRIDLALSVMGIGKLALQSRLELPSAFVYGAVKTSRFAGQPTLAQLRSVIHGRDVR